AAAVRGHQQRRDPHLRNRRRRPAHLVGRTRVRGGRGAPGDQGRRRPRSSSGRAAVAGTPAIAERAAVNRAIRHAAAAAVATASLWAPIAAAQVTVTDAWVRGTVEGQTATAAYMTLHSDHGARLV